MTRYRQVDVRTWIDERFQRLSPLQPSGQALWLYLLTNERTTSIPGLYSHGEAAMAEALGWELEAFREAFREAFMEGMVKANWKARLLWLPKAFKYNKPQSPNVIKSWAKQYDELPECSLKEEALIQLNQEVKGLSKAFQEAFRKAFGKTLTKTLANQEQEQEQEQEVIMQRLKPALKTSYLEPNKPKKVANKGEDSGPAIRRLMAIHSKYNLVRNFGPKHHSWKLIATRLTKFSEEDIGLAIVGCNEDGWCREVKKTELEYALRLSKIESHIAKGKDAKRHPLEVKYRNYESYCAAGRAGRLPQNDQDQFEFATGGMDIQGLPFESDWKEKREQIPSDSEAVVEERVECVAGEVDEATGWAVEAISVGPDGRVRGVNDHPG